jgi:hypothetical protein
VLSERMLENPDKDITVPEEAIASKGHLRQETPMRSCH